MASVNQILREAMKRRGITSRVLSRHLGYAGNSFVSNVLSGVKRLPLDRADDWAKGVRLTTRESEAFALACCLELGPPIVRQVIAGLLDRVGDPVVGDGAKEKHGAETRPPRPR